MLQTDSSMAKSASEMIEIRHEGEIFQVRLRRRAGVRRFILRVRGLAGHADLTIPKRAALRSAKEFLQSNAAWIGTQIKDSPKNLPFVDGVEIPVRGKMTRIHHAPGLRGVVLYKEVETDDGLRPILSVSGDACFIERRITDYLKSECRRDLQKSVAFYAEKLGKKPSGLTLRDTVSRWGSCSASGSLNFSWRLIFAPPEVLDYLAAHEVSHLMHMNHSPAYWKICRSLCPNVDSAEAWLKANGAHLYTYGSKALNR